MFSVYVLLGLGTLSLLGQDFGLISPNIALAAADDSIRYKVYQDKKTWDEASLACMNSGMSLAYILKKKEYDALRDYIKANNLLPTDETSGYWLDGKYNQQKGVWEWHLINENVRIDENFFGGWHYEQPRPQTRNGISQDCIELKYLNKGNEMTRSLAWNPMWCEERRGYVCQYT